MDLHRMYCNPFASNTTKYLSTQSLNFLQSLFTKEVNRNHKSRLFGSGCLGDQPFGARSSKARKYATW